jgi:DNA-directed RNA polymerase specialized sigma24 family protein
VTALLSSLDDHLQGSTNALLLPQPSARLTSAAELYMHHYAMLANVAITRYRLNRDEVQNVIHDAFALYLVSPTVIQNPRAWLVGVLCNLCREHWRYARTEFPLGEQPPLPDVEHKILSTQLLAQLPASSQRVLRLHYIEGLTAAEIASHLNTSLRYAEKMIHLGLRRARRFLRAAG